MHGPYFFACAERSFSYSTDIRTDVTGTFRNVMIAPHQAQNFCYVVDDVLVSDFRLIFGWGGIAGVLGPHGCSRRTRLL